MQCSFFLFDREDIDEDRLSLEKALDVRSCHATPCRAMSSFVDSRQFSLIFIVKSETMTEVVGISPFDR